MSPSHMPSQTREQPPFRPATPGGQGRAVSRWSQGPEVRRLYRSLFVLAVMMSALALHWYVLTTQAG